MTKRDSRGQSPMQVVLSDPDLLRNKPKGIKGYLSVLYRTIVMTINSNSLPAFNNLLVSYIINPLNGVPDNTRDRVSERGNLTKELFRDTMTWAVFCKGLRVLPIRKFRIILEAETVDRKIHVIEGKWLNFDTVTAQDFHEPENKND